MSFKKVISVVELVELSTSSIDIDKLAMESVNSLDEYFKQDESVKHHPKVVYVMCGNFASGKSAWIQSHRSDTAGHNLYIDGPNHKRYMRQLIITRVKWLKPDCRVVCVRIFSS